MFGFGGQNLVLEKKGDFLGFNSVGWEMFPFAVSLKYL